MPQEISGVFGTLDDGLPEQIDAARRAKRMSWNQLAAGSGWTRQYLQAAISRPVVPLDVLKFLADALNIHPRVNVAPTVSHFLQTTAEPT